MDDRPLAATIVPVLALALSLAAAGVVMAAQTASGRPELVRRANEWGSALSHGDEQEAAGYLSPRGLRDRGLVEELRRLVRETRGAVIRLREMRFEGEAAHVTYWVAKPMFDVFSQRPSGRIEELPVVWVRGDDHDWHVETWGR